MPYMDRVGNDLDILDKSDWGAAGGNRVTQTPKLSLGVREGARTLKIRPLWTATFKTQGSRKTKKQKRCIYSHTHIWLCKEKK